MTTTRIGLLLLLLHLVVLPSLVSTRAAATEGRDVEIDGLAATVLAPGGARLGAVIIAGSGPTDRDGNNPQGVHSDSYRQLAEALAAAGIASVRFDKRGVAGSRATLPDGEAGVSLASYARDVAAVALWLGGQPGIGKVVLIGHSEGGLLALMAAKQVAPAGIVLLATPGRPLGMVLREQMRSRLPPPLQAEVERVLTALEQGGEVGTVEAPLDQLFRPSVQPFLRSALTLDPSALIATRAEPVLIAGGGKDLQIGRTDFDRLVQAQPTARTHWEPDATHTLKLAPPDDALQTRVYTDPSLPLAAGLVAAVIAFIEGL